MRFRLLEAFRGVFEGQQYRHRRSTLGDSVAMEIFEDLHALQRSPKLVQRIDSNISVLNTQNRRIGVKARRGDGSFGEIIPGEAAIKDKGYTVYRGPIATIEVGVEVKILFKAMIKQIDRVVNDVEKQVTHFKSKGGNPICVGIIGINYADHCTSYEGSRPWPTDGKKYKHPIQEADDAEAHLLRRAEKFFDELLILKFKATNERPYLFTWLDEKETRLQYGAILTRVSQQYENRF